MKNYLLTLLFLLLCASCKLSAYELPKLEKLQVSHQMFSQPMSFNVRLPASYSTDADKRYFILFDLHPRSQAYLSGLQDWLSHNGEWPWLETIVVTPASYHKEFAELFERTAKQPADMTMLDFIGDGLLSAVDKNYRTNGFRIYAGFMSNGAIGLYSLLNRPDLFNAYILSSPTLADDFLNIHTQAAKKIAALDKRARFLYLLIGEHGYEKAHIDAVENLRETLQKSAPDSLDWTVDTKDPNYYMSRPVFALLNGIEQLFDDYHNDLTADSPISQRGVDAIIEHYKTLSEDKYGFAVSAEGSLKNLAKSLLESSPEQALKIFHKVLELYPDSAYAHADLAAVYEARGELKKAIELQTIAVDKSKRLNLWHQRKLTQQLKNYRSKLSVN